MLFRLYMWDDLSTGNTIFLVSTIKMRISNCITSWSLAIVFSLSELEPRGVVQKLLLLAVVWPCSHRAETTSSDVNFSILRVTVDWHRLPRAVVEFLSLFKSQDWSLTIGGPFLTRELECGDFQRFLLTSATLLFLSSNTGALSGSNN